jgi:hypothetical protein
MTENLTENLTNEELNNLTQEQQEQLLMKYELQKQKRHDRYIKLKEQKDQQNSHKNSSEIVTKILNSKTVLKLLKTIKKPNKNDELNVLEIKYIELKEKYDELYNKQFSNDTVIDNDNVDNGDVDIIVDDVTVE